MRKRVGMVVEQLAHGTAPQSLTARAPLGVETEIMALAGAKVLATVAARGLKTANLEVEVQAFLGRRQCLEALEVGHGNKAVMVVKILGLQRAVMVTVNLAVVVPDPGKVPGGEETAAVGRPTREALASGSEMSVRRAEAASARRLEEDERIITCRPKVALAGMDRQGGKTVVVQVVAGMAAHSRKVVGDLVEGREAA